MIKNRALLVSFFIAFTSPTFASELSAVAQLDLNRYMGQWYEIARLPMKHQEGCLKSEANYQMLDGMVNITNRCTLADGKFKEITGVGKVEDKVSNAKLKVNFVPIWLRWMGIGWGNYWVIEIDADYQYAVVSEPKREFLWILSRKPSMPQATYDGITTRLIQNGFDLSKMIITGERE